MTHKKNSFLYSAAILACSNVALQLLGFVYRIFLGQLVGAEGLGVYRLAYLAYSVINSVCLSGVCFAVARLSAQNQQMGRLGLCRHLVTSAIKIFMVLFALCGGIILLKSQFLATYVLGDSRTRYALVAMLFCLFLTGFENILKALFLGTNRIKSMAASELGEQLVRIAAVLGLLFYFGGDNIALAVVLIMVGMGISEIFSVSFLLLQYKKHFSQLPPCEKTKSLTLSVVGLALPISASALITNVISSASSVILPAQLMLAGYTRQEALSQLGIISSMAYPLILLPMALISSISSLLMPSISRLAVGGNKTQIREKIMRAIKTTGFIGLPATAALVPLAKPLTRLFFSVDLAPSYFIALGLSAAFLYFQMILCSLLNGLGREKGVMVTAALAETLQLLLTVALVPRLGIYGYIYAMLVSEIFCIAVALWLLRGVLGEGIGFFALNIEAIFSAITIYLWVRLLYFYALGFFYTQATAVLVAALGAAILYVFILRLWGISLGAYLKILSPLGGKLRSLIFV